MADGSFKRADSLLPGDKLLSLTENIENVLVLCDKVRRGKRAFAGPLGRPICTLDQVCMGRDQRKTAWSADDAIYRRHWKICDNFVDNPPLCLVEQKEVRACTSFVTQEEDSCAFVFGIVSACGYGLVQLDEGAGANNLLLINTEIIDGGHPVAILLVYEMLRSINYAHVPADPQNDWSKEKAGAFFHACFTHALLELAGWADPVDIEAVASQKLAQFLNLAQVQDKALRLADAWWHLEWQHLQALELAVFATSTPLEH